MDEIQKFINDQRKQSTVSSTVQHVNKLKKFLMIEKEEIREIHNIDAAELNSYLSEFFYLLKKNDNEDYEPSSICAIRAAIDRHLRENYYPNSIMNDKEFDRTRQVINAKCRSLKKKGLGRRQHASEVITREEEKMLLDKNILGKHNPTSLQNAIFFQFCKGFGLRGRDEHRQMRFGDVIVKETTQGQKFLELTERKSKTMDGTKVADCRQTRPKIFSTDNSENDPVNLFQAFCAHRPEEAKTSDSAMYLTPIPEKHVKNLDNAEEVWFRSTPMGKNMLGNIVKKCCDAAGIAGKKTNHSLRKTCVTALSDAGVPPHKIIKITGHRSTSSLQHYDRDLRNEEHVTLSNILQNQPEKTPQTTCTNQETTQQNALMSAPLSSESGPTFNGTYQNCTFSFVINQK